MCICCFIESPSLFLEIFFLRSIEYTVYNIETRQNSRFLIFFVDNIILWKISGNSDWSKGQVICYKSYLKLLTDPFYPTKQFLENYLTYFISYGILLHLHFINRNTIDSQVVESNIENLLYIYYQKDGWGSTLWKIGFPA